MTPDEFRILDPLVIENPYPFYQALLEHAPVYRVPGTGVFLVSSWHTIHEALRNQEDYSANLTGVMISDEQGEPTVFDLSVFGGAVDALANADEPFHAIHRKLVLPQLNARRVEAMEEEVRAWAVGAVEKLLAQKSGDVVAELANPIPVKVMARLVGLPVEDVGRLLTWAFAGGDILAGTTTLEKMIELGESTAALASYLSEHFERVQADDIDSADNIMQELALGLRAGLIDERAALAILIVLVGAAGESTSSLVGSAIRLLAEDQGLQQELRQSPELIGAFVEEVVRLESPFRGHYRHVLRDSELGGVSIPAGSRLFLLWAAANREAAIFPAPDAIDLQRTNPEQHLGFGYGIHFCIGARVARMEARVILEELLTRTRNFMLDETNLPVHVASIFVRRLPRLMLNLEASAGRA